MQRNTLRLLTVATLASACSIAFARDGDLDVGFGTAGKTFFKYGSQFIDTYNQELLSQPDGKLIVIGSRNFADPDYDFAATRLMPDGTFDTTFGSGGQTFYNIDRVGSDKGDHVVGGALQSDGKIVLGGFSDGDASTGEDFTIVRLNTDGSHDTTFGTAGLTVVPFNLGNCAAGGCDDEALRVNVQADGKILLIGSATSNPDVMTPKSAFAIVRLTATGQRDSTFDVDGRITLDFGTGDFARGYRIKQLADGAHLIAVGAANTTPGSNNTDFAMAKLNADGSFDVTFGIGGKTTYGFDIGGADSEVATDFIELADGKLLVCGEVQVNAPNNYDFGCMRFLANGTPDPTFGPVLIPFDIGGGFADAPLRMERDAKGRIILAGFVEVTTNSFDFAMTRISIDGALDTSFGKGGLVTYNGRPGSGASDQSNGAGGLAIQPDGKIVLVGYTNTTSTGNPIFEVVRAIGDTIFSDGFEQ